MKEEGIWGGVHLLVLLMTVLFNNQYLPQNHFYIYLSILMLLIGIVVFFVSWRELGEFRVGIYPGNSLVTSGIYSKIRNPIYLGIKIIYFGFALFFKSIIGIILVFILIFPLHAYRARREEQELIKKFGERYIEYKKRTLF